MGIFKTGMFEYDSSLAFVTLNAARDVLGLPPGFLSGIEITVRDVFKADQVAARCPRNWVRLSTCAPGWK